MTLVSEFAILAQKWLKTALWKKNRFLGLCNSLLMGLGQDQKQHPAVHTGGISKGTVRVCVSER